MSERVYDERDYIDRTIQTVRNHRRADNCWPQWANIFADEIERLRASFAAAETREKTLREALVKARGYVEEPGSPGTIVETTEESSIRSAELLRKIDAALAASRPDAEEPA